MFFTPVLVLVEGLEDAAFLMSHLVLTGKEPDFRRFGCHIVHADGKRHLVQLRAVAKCLDIPTFTVFDSDGDQCVAPKGCTDAQKLNRFQKQRAEHEKDNRALLSLCDRPSAEPFPTSNLFETAFVAWRDSITSAVREDFGSEAYIAAEQAVRQLGMIASGSLGKNAMFIGLVLEQFMQQGKTSDVLGRTVDAILEFAEQQG